jgi:hypothetical protein
VVIDVVVLIVEQVAIRTVWRDIITGEKVAQGNFEEK